MSRRKTGYDVRAYQDIMLKFIKFLLSSALIAAALGGCSGADVLNTFAARQGVVVQKDVAYGPGPRRMLDVYAPDAAANAPVVVFFYGGGWTAGSRNIYRFLGTTLAKRGVVVVIPDYRLYPEVKFPAFMEDAAAAVAWAKTHIAAYGGNPKHLFIMGHSAGGQIGALLSLNADYLKAVGMAPQEITGFIGIAGAYDFLPLENPTYKIIFGPEEQRPLSQPVTFASAAAPPMLLTTGKDDDTVLPRNSHRLAAKLESFGRPVTVKIYDKVGHITIMGAFSPLLSFLAPVRQDVLDFIAAHPAAANPTPSP
jgi:acetyl esterase/lipase